MTCSWIGPKINNPLDHPTSSVKSGTGGWQALARAACLALLPLTVACSSGTPTSPSANEGGPAAGTRVVNVVGNLAFGDVPVGSQRSMTYTITNSGNATLTVAGTTISGGLASQTLFSWTHGQIAPGASQTVTVRFQPTTAGSYNGTITVNGDQTGGTNVVAISGSAAGASFAGAWAGRYVVERCDGTGSNQDYFCGPRGAYPPGASLPISVSLTQSGSSVNGTIQFGQVRGVVTGAISSSGALVLQGSASGGQVSLALSSWQANVSGASMTGTFAYNAGLQGVPGIAVVVSRFSGVVRQ